MLRHVNAGDIGGGLGGLKVVLGSVQNVGLLLVLMDVLFRC